MTREQLATRLQAEQRRFMAFLTPRLGSREAARDLLQAAMLKAVERRGALRKDESVVAWFFRLLRNSLVDHYRRLGVERRTLEGQGVEATLAGDVPDLQRHICACVSDLTASLCGDQGGAVRAVDLDGKSIAEYAADSGITSGNARVRLHRARGALSRRLVEMCGTCCAQGCSNCPCDAQAPP